MKGYLWTEGHAVQKPLPAGQAKLAQWEEIAIEAVGNVIEFWGFKRNQGRVWALLYLRDEALTAAELEKELDLSKGGVSMLIRDLERWGVILRVRNPGDSAWRYRAETELVKMARRVIEEREFVFIARIRADLEAAQASAASAGKVAKIRLERLAKMSALAENTEKALKLFLKTSRFDVSSMFDVFSRS
ncbi:MAG: MarR family transcriptional regulator [Myxococcaceae bacterium]|nr:MarR family transcriptional regulator [Myxococcaceae bacterium]